MLNIPAFQYKLKVICVDDNESYLSSLAGELSKYFTVEAFSDPIAALNYIQSIKNDTSAKFLEITPDFESSRVLVDLKFNQIENLASIEKSEIGIVIVDHHMPEMTGIEFCRQLPENICKILLTGDGDSNEAVKYFNNNVIDYYYLKGASNLIDELNEVIIDSTKQIFIDKTLHIYQALSTTNFPLTAKNLCKFIADTLALNHAEEFYLIDKNGSFLFIKNRIKNYIMVHTDDSINEFIENYQDIKSVEEIINKIQLKEIIPNFHNVLPEHIPYESWKDYVAPCQTVEDIHNYYVAVIYG